MTHEQAAGRASQSRFTARFQHWAEAGLERLRDWSQRVPGLAEPVQAGAPVGLSLTPHGLAIASVQRTAGARPRLTRCEYHPLPRQADPSLLLRAIMLQAGAESERYNLVLGPDDYQLHLVEAPAVPDSELREAVRWRVRDLIDLPVDEAALDVFDMPQQSGSGREAARMMCVVVARNPVIAQKAALVTRGGGEIAVVDIADLALRNLLALGVPDTAGSALLQVEPSYSVILVTAGSTLYLSRRIWIGQQDLAGLAGKEPGSEEFRRIGDALAMELLRSLEYYESHFARPAVSAVHVAGALEPELLGHLAQAVGVPVAPLDITARLEGAAAVPAEVLSRSLLAIGAALRQERVSP